MPKGGSMRRAMRSTGSFDGGTTAGTRRSRRIRLSVGNDGYRYGTANQLRRQPDYHDGKDLRVKPYSLFRVKTDGTPVRLR